MNFIYNRHDRSKYQSNAVEFWKSIEQSMVPGVDPNRYLISTFGNTWDNFENKPMHTVISKGTKYYVYLRISIIKENGYKDWASRKLHRMVMMAFAYFPGCENYQVNHIDGNKQNNNIANLEWVTNYENKMHAIETGLQTTIFDKQFHRFTDEQLKQMKELYYLGYSYEHIVYELSLDVSPEVIGRIFEGKTKYYSQKIQEI